MWEDTKEYRQIIQSVKKWQSLKERVHIRAIWVRSNGEYQEKEGYFYNALDWLLDNLETYWLPDESEVKVFVEDEVFYWKHPEIAASLTIKDIEEEDKNLKELFEKSGIRVDEHFITFGVNHG